jgi:hypothetical protein
MRPIAIAFLAKKITVVKKIVITFASPPTTVNITNAFYRYDKKFAITSRYDDGYIDCYQTAFKLFNGGTIIHEDGVIANYPGLSYTDNCGNNIKFTASSAINSSNVSLDAVPTYIMNYNMINELYVAGWALWNTGKNDFGATNDFENLPSDTARYQKALDEIIGGQEDIRIATSIKVKNFTAPFNSDFYDGPSYSLFLSGQLKIINNIIGITNSNLFNNGVSQQLATKRPWEQWMQNNYIGVQYDYVSHQDNNITRTTNTDTNFIATEVAKCSSTYHPIISLGTHTVSLSETHNGAKIGGSISPTFSNIFASFRFLSYKWFYEEVASRWGSTGTDQLIFVPIDDLYNYEFTKRNTKLNVVTVGNTVEISCDFSKVDIDFRDHSLSLLINSNAVITNISYVGFDNTSHNIGYSGSNLTALVNASYKPTYETAVRERAKSNVLISKAQKSQNKTDFDLAQAYVTALRSGSFKDAAQAKLNVITVIPDSLIMQVDFGKSGSGYSVPFPWNSFSEITGYAIGSKLTNLNTTSGNISNISIEITSPFSIWEANFPADPGNLPYPYEVCRDVFRTNAGLVSKLKLSNLNMNKVYDLKFYAARGFVGNVSRYTVKGTIVTMPHKTNIFGTVDILNIIPDTGGTLEISVNGDTSANPGFIGMLQITEKNP